jgi:hypothetical protein
MFNAVTFLLGCVTAQKRSHWLPTVAFRVQARVRSCGICGGQCGTGTGFLQVLWFLCQFSFHRLLRSHHHPSSGAGSIGQIVTDVPSGISLTKPQEKRSYEIKYIVMQYALKCSQTYHLNVTFSHFPKGIIFRGRNVNDMWANILLSPCNNALRKNVRNSNENELVLSCITEKQIF